MKPYLAFLALALVGASGCFSSNRMAHLAYVSTRPLEGRLPAPDHWVRGEVCGGPRLMNRAIDATLAQEPGATGLADARLEQRDRGAFHTCYSVTARPVTTSAPPSDAP